MASTITLTRDEYELLLDYGYDRKTDQTLLRELQRRIDYENDIKRYALYIRWFEVGGQPPSRIDIQENNGWPPTQQFLLRQDRPISREDVDVVLRNQATNPVSTTVTADERGIVGWAELEVWDFNLNV